MFLFRLCVYALKRAPFAKMIFCFCNLRPKANIREKLVTVCPDSIAIYQESVAPSDSIPLMNHSREGEKTLDIQLMAFKVNS